MDINIRHFENARIFTHDFRVYYVIWSTISAIEYRLNITTRAQHFSLFSVKFGGVLTSLKLLTVDESRLIKFTNFSH
jgi:hypothetical protein